MDLYDDMLHLKQQSLKQRPSRDDNRWIAPFYMGLSDFKVGQHIWVVGTVGRGCDNRIWEEIITGETMIDDMGEYLNFGTKSVDMNCGCWHRFNSIGQYIFFTKEEADLSLQERMQEVYKL